MRLRDKVCVVTGSGSGIGRATAIEMAREGAKVVVSDVNDDNGAETVKAIRDARGEAVYAHADVTSADDVTALMQAAVDAFGRLDVLHNNAGVHETDFTTETAVDTLPEEVWDRHPLVVGFDSWEQSVAIMPDRLGDKAAWGSRYPNHDAAGPDEARTMLEAEGVDTAMIDRLMGGNAAGLFRLQVPATA